MAEREVRPVLVTYVGATGRTLTVTIYQDSGVVYNLTGLTVTITAKLNGTAKISAGVMTVAAPTTGVATYTPLAAGIDESGLYDAQIKMVTAGGLIDYTEPFYFDVRAVV